MPNVLIAGESWISEATHYKGYDSFTSVTYHTGVTPLKSALEAARVDVTFMPGHLVPAEFPSGMAELRKYQVVILSDIGANSILLHPDTWLGGHTHTNRLELLADWVRAGGSLAMMGGYLSFQGFEAKAQYFNTPIEHILPVKLTPYDDRVEAPQGLIAEVTLPGHSILRDVSGPWPALLGYNKLQPKDDATVLAKIGDDPLLAVREVESGRTLAWASDIGPHWCPDEFTGWEHYAHLFVGMTRWLAEAAGNASKQ